LVVAKDSGRPRDGFAAWDLKDFDTGVEQVHAFDWATYGNPFGFAADGTRVEDLVRKLVADPSAASDVYAVTKVRGTVQMLFRDALLRAYGGACAISGSKLTPGLEAAHILPWSAATVHERLSIRNGIIVTAWHHRLLDGGLISLDEDHRIRVQPKAWERASGYDRAHLEEFDGRSLHLPADPLLHPDPALIRRRNDFLRNSVSVSQAGRAAS
jgi:putative restriction endonuclease